MQNVHTTAFILVQASLRHAVRQKATTAAAVATPEDYGGFEMVSSENTQPADDDNDDDVAKGNVYECTEKEEPPAYDTLEVLY